MLDIDELDNLNSFEIPVLLTDMLSRVILTRTDVLHSLGVPSLGIKLDSIPGRLNSITTNSTLPGVFNGSCYELCGRGHSVIPVSFLSI